MTKKCFLTKHSIPLYADCIEEECAWWVSSLSLVDNKLTDTGDCAVTVIAKKIGEIRE